MDFVLVRTVSTVVMFVVFIGIAGWAFGRGQKKRFDEDAEIPFREGDEFGPDRPTIKGRQP